MSLIEDAYELAKQDYGYEGKPLQWRQGFDAAAKELLVFVKDMMIDHQEEINLLRETNIETLQKYCDTLEKLNECRKVLTQP